MKKTALLLSATLLFSIGSTLSAADIFVSLKTGKNKNSGAKDAPL